MAEPQTNADPEQIVRQMMEGDRFSQWLGLEIEEVREGYCRLAMVVRDEMVNGFSILHGGITFSMADSCFAFASNSLGKLCVSLQAGMHFPRPARAGDRLVAESKEVSRGRSSIVLDINIFHASSGEQIGAFRGTGHRFDRSPFEK
jgi:acyl-CoA thioesterase